MAFIFLPLLTKPGKPFQNGKLRIILKGFYPKDFSCLFIF